MKRSTKIIAALAAVGILGAGAAAVAQPGGCDGRMGMHRASFEPGKRVEQHLDRLKADLKLTPTQEPLWQAFADQAKAEAGKGMQAMRDNAQDLTLSAPDRMARTTQLMKQRLAAMESINASFTRLYDALTPDQKRVADIHAARVGHGGHHGHFRGDGPRGQTQG